MERHGATVSKRRHQAGQTTLEFAMVGSVLLLIMFAVMQMGTLLFTYNTIADAARESARYAIVHSPTSAHPAATSQIQQVAIDAAGGLNLTTSNVAVSWPPDPNLPSQTDALIQISYGYSLQIPFMSSVTLTLTSSSQMVVSQ